MSYTRFVIISHLRSGTHLLRTLLESHPLLVCQTEVFNSDNPNLPYSLSISAGEILDKWVYTDFPTPIRCAGFVLQAYHPGGLRAFPGIRENPYWNEVWPRLQSMSGLKVIHLRRENGLRRHLSHVLARRTGAWHNWDPVQVHEVSHIEAPLLRDAKETARPRVTLDAERLRIDFEEVAQLHRRVERLFGKGAYYPLTYEQLIADQEKLSVNLLRFLGVAPRPLKAAVRKIETRALHLSIENYEVLRQQFAGTCWQHYFEDNSSG